MPIISAAKLRPRVSSRQNVHFHKTDNFRQVFSLNRFVDLANTFDTANLTVARNSHKIDGQTSDLTVATEGAAFALVYSGATQGWKLLEK